MESGDRDRGFQAFGVEATLSGNGQVINGYLSVRGHFTTPSRWKGQHPTEEEVTLIDGLFTNESHQKLGGPLNACVLRFPIAGHTVAIHVHAVHTGMTGIWLLRAVDPQRAFSRHGQTTGKRTTGTPLLPVARATAGSIAEE